MSLITFRSPTQGSVIMFPADAKQLLRVLALPERGELTSAQIAACITQLKAAIAADKAQHPIVWPETQDDDMVETDPEAAIIIRFSQRATPMLQLMERCLAATETICWPA